jgi:hypothetical protein
MHATRVTVSRFPMILQSMAMEADQSLLRAHRPMVFLFHHILNLFFIPIEFINEILYYDIRHGTNTFQVGFSHGLFGGKDDA